MAETAAAEGTSQGSAELSRRQKQRARLGKALEFAGLVLTPRAAEGVDAADLRIRRLERLRWFLKPLVPRSIESHRSLWSVHSMYSGLSVYSFGSIGSVLSMGSAGSMLCLGSTGSILSIGSMGSILSIGSVGSSLSIGKVANRPPGSFANGSTSEPNLTVVNQAGTVIGVLAVAGAALRR